MTTNAHQKGKIVFYNHTTKEQQRMFDMLQSAKNGDLICSNLLGDNYHFNSLILSDLLNSIEQPEQVSRSYMEKMVTKFAQEHASNIESDSLDVFYSIAEDIVEHERKWVEGECTTDYVQEELINDHLRLLIGQYDEWDNYYGIQTPTLQTVCEQTTRHFCNHYVIPIYNSLAATGNFKMNDPVSVIFKTPYTFEISW